MDKMSYTLVIVDVQYDFSATRSLRLKNNCIHEIKRAVARKADILFVEYSGCHPTIPRIKKPSSGYNRSFSVIKDNDDGGEEVFNSIKRYKLKKKLRVIGVNTDQCVYSTVRTLAQEYQFPIEVISAACNSDLCHKDGLYEMKRLSNVKVR